MQILFPCVLHMMEVVGLVLVIKVAFINKKHRLILMHQSKWYLVNGKFSCFDSKLFDILFIKFTICSPTYTITATQLRVGESLINSSFTALFDSGTSFTYLVDPHYTRLTKMVRSEKKIKTL